MSIDSSPKESAQSAQARQTLSDIFQQPVNRAPRLTDKQLSAIRKGDPAGNTRAGAFALAQAARVAQKGDKPKLGV